MTYAIFGIFVCIVLGSVEIWYGVGFGEKAVKHVNAWIWAGVCTVNIRKLYSTKNIFRFFSS